MDITIPGIDGRYPEARLDTSRQTVSQHDCKQLHTLPETAKPNSLILGTGGYGVGCN